MAKTVVSKKEESWKHHKIFPQTLRYCHPDCTVLSKNQQNRTGTPEINPQIYSQLIFNKGTKNTYQRKDSLFIDGAGEAGCVHKEQNSAPASYPTHKSTHHGLKTPV
jgi:hypothetical protein